MSEQDEIAALQAARDTAVRLWTECGKSELELQQQVAALQSRNAELVEALREAAAWLSAYQFAFPDGHEKGKRLDKMRADLRSSAAGNGVTNVATAAIAQARAALSKSPGAA